MTGSGTPADPYVIQDVLDLQDIEDDLNAYYFLEGDIDASATTTWNGGDGFVPISQFGGTLDGRGYKITDLWCDRWNVTSYQALIAIGYGCTVLNLGVTGSFKGKIGSAGMFGFLGDYQYDDPPYLIRPFNVINCWTDVYVKGTRECGGFVGSTYAQAPYGDNPLHMNYIKDCHSKGTVEGYNSSSWCNAIGGFMGGDWGSGNCLIEVSNCYSECNVTGLNTFTASGLNAYLGGFAGYLGGWTVKDCYATGDVTGTLGGQFYDVGGFVGYYVGKGTVPLATKVERCYATGNVKGYRRVGGFAGRCSTYYHDLPFLAECFAHGNATSEGSGNHTVGGFVGWCEKTATVMIVKHCYSTGVPTGSSNVGGFCGDATDPDDIVQCFWDSWTSGTTVSDGGIWQPTPQMKTEATFTDEDWDFDSVWFMDPTEVVNDGYPFFKPAGAPAIFWA